MHELYHCKTAACSVLLLKKFVFIVFANLVKQSSTVDQNQDQSPCRPSAVIVPVLNCFLNLPCRFQEAMAQYTVDHVQRMKQIKAMLDDSSQSGDAVQQKQNMLEELMDIVDNIDHARGMVEWLMVD